MTPTQGSDGRDREKREDPRQPEQPGPAEEPGAVLGPAQELLARRA